MNKLLISAALVLTMASTAHAGTFVVKGDVTSVKPNYVTISKSVPTQQCQEIDIPIYNQSSSNGNNNHVGNILGAIVGGVVGNQFGGGNGKTAATAGGAVIGSIVGGTLQENNNSNNRDVVGYRRETRCTMVDHVTTEQKIKDYTVKYEWNGFHGAVITYNQFNVGDAITLNMDLRAK